MGNAAALVVGVDRSPESAAALATALRWSTELGRPLSVIHAVGLALLGRVGNLGHDVVEEVELLVLGDGLLEVDGADALRVALLGFGGGFGDQGDHEQLEGFCCAVG